jgi:hypothetical protein
MDTAIMSRLLVTLALALALNLANPSEATEKPTVRIVHPCPSKPRIVPITEECVAAAIAEEAFLHYTQNKIDRYLIEAQQQPTALWKFVIEAGDETHPGPDGSHWFIHIDRSTGEIEIVDGR